MADAGQRALAERSDGTSTNGIPTLEGPFMDMKYVVQNNRDVAKQLRDANKELLRDAKVREQAFSLSWSTNTPALHACDEC